MLTSVMPCGPRLLGHSGVTLRGSGRTEYCASRDGIDGSEAETWLRNTEVFSESNLSMRFF